MYLQTPLQHSTPVAHVLPATGQPVDTRRTSVWRPMISQGLTAAAYATAGRVMRKRELRDALLTCRSQNVKKAWKNSVMPTSASCSSPLIDFLQSHNGGHEEFSFLVSLPLIFWRVMLNCQTYSYAIMLEHNTLLFIGITVIGSAPF